MLSGKFPHIHQFVSEKKKIPKSLLGEFFFLLPSQSIIDAAFYFPTQQRKSLFFNFFSLPPFIQFKLAMEKDGTKNAH